MPIVNNASKKCLPKIGLHRSYLLEILINLWYFLSQQHYSLDCLHIHAKIGPFGPSSNWPPPSKNLLSKSPVGLNRSKLCYCLHVFRCPRNRQNAPQQDRQEHWTDSSAALPGGGRPQRPVPVVQGDGGGQPHQHTVHAWPPTGPDLR